jgi:hypothetical protein
MEKAPRSPYYLKSTINAWNHELSYKPSSRLLSKPIKLINIDFENHDKERREMNHKFKILH